MVEHGDQRASDADRAQIVERLRHAADEGRLALDEFDERTGQALGARTYRELDAIVADLLHTRTPAERRGRFGAVRRRPHGLTRTGGRTAVALRRHRMLVAGALATVAVAAPLTALAVATSASSAAIAPGMCARDRPPASSSDSSCWWYTDPASVRIDGKRLPKQER